MVPHPEASKPDTSPEIAARRALQASAYQEDHALMTVPSLNPDKMTPATIALFDRLADGQWHSNRDLIAMAAPLCIEHEHTEALKNGHRVRRKSLAGGKVIDEAALLDSGAKDMVRNRLMIAVRSNRLERTKTEHRMLPEVCTAWRALRPSTVQATPCAPTRPAAPVAATTPVAVPSALAAVADPGPVSGTGRKTGRTHIFGGIPEEDGWSQAPLRLHSRVHFKVENGEVPLTEFRTALPTGCTVTFEVNSGLYRVDCPHGTGTTVRDLIRTWCEARGMTVKGLRAKDDVWRRDPHDLDQAYLADLCLEYEEFLRGRILKSRSTLQFHFADRDDLTQQVYVWILEAVERYDEQSGVPFGAFLATRVKDWVHNLNRSKYGRNLSDTELRHQRASQEFTRVHGREPSASELATALGEDLTKFRKDAQVVANMQNLRYVGTLDATPDDSEVPLPSDDLSDDRFATAEHASLVSRVLTSACTVDETARGKAATRPNVLGWVAKYETHWGGKTKAEAAAALATSARNMKEYTDRVDARLPNYRADVLGH